MEQEVLEKLKAQDEKLDAIYKSAEKTRKYLLWTLIITIIVIVLPLIALAFIIPWIFNAMNSAFGL